MVKEKNDKPTKGPVSGRPRSVKVLMFVLAVICAGLFAADHFVKRYHDHPWEEMFGFYAVYGFAVSFLLILAAREMRKLILRKETYYDE